jgi:hypothetical protein
VSVVGPDSSPRAQLGSSYLRTRPAGRRLRASLEVSGDPLQGGKCKRYDWGGWSDAIGTENPMDPTRDIKPAMQS